VNDRAATYLAVARIAAVVGMAFALAVGILLIVGGWLALGALALVASVPFFALMRLVERNAGRREVSGRQ
jgi:hypothetical protein